MANDRLFLRCRQCGKTIGISKHFISPWYIDKRNLDAINEFLDEHCFCSNSKYDVPYNSFDLVTECGEGFPCVYDDKILYNSYDIAPSYDEQKLKTIQIVCKNQEENLSKYIENVMKDEHKEE